MTKQHEDPAPPCRDQRAPAASTDRGATAVGGPEEALPIVFPTDVVAAHVGQRIRLVVQAPANPQHAVAPASLRVGCDARDLRLANANQCRHCKIYANGGLEEVVELSLPLEELTKGAQNTRKFVNTQARRRVRCGRDCSTIAVVESRDVFSSAAFEPLHPDRIPPDGRRPPALAVQVISGRSLPTDIPLLVTGRVVERTAHGLCFVHDGPVQSAPEPPGIASRLQARGEIERFLQLDDPLRGLTWAAQRDITGTVLASMSDLTTAVLLALCSPVGLPFRDGRECFTHRVNLMIIGDTGVRKSTIVKLFIDAIGFGELITATTSIAGLIGTVLPGRGSCWGALVREHRGLVVIEESATLKRQVIAAMRDLRERGSVAIHMNGTSYYAPAAPAIIETCNPGMNRTLASFPIWAEALLSLPNHELADLRRCTVLIPMPAESLHASAIDTADVPRLSAATLRTLAWVARTIGPNRLQLDDEAVACAEQAEAALRPSLLPHPALQAIANHTGNKILHLASAWAVAAAVPLEGETVRVTAEHVKAVCPLFQRTLRAWTTRGSTDLIDTEEVADIVWALRQAGQSLGRKPRTDPLAGLRGLSAAPLGLTLMEWSTRMAISDKTIRTMWLKPLFEPHGLVERRSTRYWITPLGLAVAAAADQSPPEPSNSLSSGNPDHGSGGNVEHSDIAECRTLPSRLPTVV